MASEHKNEYPQLPPNKRESVRAKMIKSLSGEGTEAVKGIAYEKIIKRNRKPCFFLDEQELEDFFEQLKEQDEFSSVGIVRTLYYQGPSNNKKNCKTITQYHYTAVHVQKKEGQTRVFVIDSLGDAPKSAHNIIHKSYKKAHDGSEDGITIFTSTRDQHEKPLGCKIFAITYANNMAKYIDMEAYYQQLEQRPPEDFYLCISSATFTPLEGHLSLQEVPDYQLPPRLLKLHQAHTKFLFSEEAEGQQLPLSEPVSIKKEAALTLPEYHQQFGPGKRSKPGFTTSYATLYRQTKWCKEGSHLDQYLREEDGQKEAEQALSPLGR